MSGNQNHDSPSCARGANMVFCVLTGVKRESSVPGTPCALTSTTERFSFERELFKLVLVQRGCQIARAEKGNERVVS